MILNQLIKLQALIFVSFSAWSQTYDEMKLANANFEIVDKAVLLVEKYVEVKITHDVKIKLHRNEGETRSFIHVVEDICPKQKELCNTQGTINSFIIAYIGLLEDSLDGKGESAWALHQRKLYHHTKKLFHKTDINQGRDFDENLLSIYHQFRIQTQTLLEIEYIREYNKKLLREDSLIKCQLLEAFHERKATEIRMINKFKALQDSVNFLSEHLRKFNIGDQLFRRGKLKFEYDQLNDTTRQKILIENRGNYKAVKKAMRQKIKKLSEQPATAKKQIQQGTKN
jgi:hypothetical protein